MTNTTRTIILWAAIGIAGVGSAAHAQADASQPKLHLTSRWKECSFQLDPALTQAAWHQFTREAAAVTYFRPLTGAKSLGTGKFELSLMQWKTGIDASDAAWNDTFVHPDSTHWLFEGSGLKFPGMSARVGVSSRTDVGAYFTRNPNANYGFYGGQLQQNLDRDSWKKVSLAARASFVSMYGPEDVAFSVYGVDVVGSREFSLLNGRATLSPYAVVSSTLARSHEKSALVSLHDESVLGAQGTVGVEARVWRATVAAEYGMASVRSFSLKVGIGSL